MGNMNQLNVGLSRLNDDALYHLAVTVVNNVGGMAVFSALAALLPPITTAAGALESAMALPYGATRETSIAAARATLGGLLQNLVERCESTPGVTTAQLAETGFTLRRKATHTSEPPAAPGNLRLKTTGISGEMLVLIAAVLRAKMYEVEWTLDPVNGPWTMVPAFESSRGMKLTGLTRGKDYYVRVRAVATGGGSRPVERCRQRAGDVRGGGCSSLRGV